MGDLKPPSISQTVPLPGQVPVSPSAAVPLASVAGLLNRLLPTVQTSVQATVKSMSS